ETLQRPRPDGIARFVDSVSGRGRLPADRGLSRAGVDHRGIRGRDRDRADRTNIEKVVRDVAPGHTGVGRLPDSAPGAADIERGGVTGYSRDRGGASRSEGANVAPL